MQAPTCLSTTCPALDEHDRRNVADHELAHDVVVVIHVALADDRTAFVFAGQLVDDRADHAAGTAPFRPKVDDYREAGDAEISSKLSFVIANAYF